MVSPGVRPMFSRGSGARTFQGPQGPGIIIIILHLDEYLSCFSLLGSFLISYNLLDILRAQKTQCAQRNSYQVSSHYRKSLVYIECRSLLITHSIKSTQGQSFLAHPPLTHTLRL